MYTLLFDFSHPTIVFLIIASYNLLKCKLNFWFLVQQKNPEAITSTFARKAEPTAHQHPLLKDLQQRFETTKQIAVPKTRDWASLFPGSRIPQPMPVWGAHLNLWAWSIRNSGGVSTGRSPDLQSVPCLWTSSRRWKYLVAAGST